MEKYTIYVTETLRREVNVEASSYADAIDEVARMYNNEEIVLDYDDLVDISFGNPVL